jgi:hypothetical protein
MVIVRVISFAVISYTVISYGTLMVLVRVYLWNTYGAR